MTNAQQLQHLYWRAGFGPRPQDVTAGLSPRKALRQLLHDSASFAPLDGPGLHYQEPPGEEMATSAIAPATPPVRRRDLTPAQRKQQNQDIKQTFNNISLAWMERMATSPGQLREKMTLFWHGHFACRVRQPDAALRLHNTTRQYALGKFGDLLRAVSREPAMLDFLNNRQNRRQHPNENFAREVMELFTLGRGNYTENDVKEAARAFTGWNYDHTNNFKINARDHDDGPKTFLGRNGNLSGDDVLAIILEQPATASFIVTKIYRFFVNDTPDPARIAPLAAAFRRSDYDLNALLKSILSADWFYEPANIGTHLKSPVELLAGLRRTLNLGLANPLPLLGYQQALGQTLFQPPNVAGWPGGRAWIDSSSLLLRLQLPAILFRNAELQVALKQDENDIAPNQTHAERTVGTGVGAQLPLAPLYALLGATPATETAKQLAAFLLQAPIRPESMGLVQQAVANAAPTESLRTALVSLLSLPEYQLS